MHVCVCVCTLCIVCTMFSFPSVHLITYDDGVALPWMWFWFTARLFVPQAIQQKSIVIVSLAQLIWSY